jgi:hypothetical protein
MKALFLKQFAILDERKWCTNTDKKETEWSWDDQLVIILFFLVKLVFTMYEIACWHYIWMKIIYVYVCWYLKLNDLNPHFFKVADEGSTMKFSLIKNKKS